MGNIPPKMGNIPPKMEAWDWREKRRRCCWMGRSWCKPGALGRGLLGKCLTLPVGSTKQLHALEMETWDPAEV